MDYRKQKFLAKQREFQIKTKNNIAELKFDQYVLGMQRDTKIKEWRFERSKTALETNLDKLKTFRKFQYEIELEQKIIYLKNFIRIQLEKEMRRLKFRDMYLFRKTRSTDLVQLAIESSELFNQLKEKVESHLLSKFSTTYNVHPVFLHIDISRPKNYILPTLRSNLDILNYESLKRAIDGKNFFRLINEELMKIENKNLSMVLSGRINDYHIYRLREDGSLKSNIRQPLIKPAYCLNESEIIQAEMLNIKWKLEREHTIEIDKRIKKFVPKDLFSVEKSDHENKKATHPVESADRSKSHSVLPGDQETNKE